MIKIRRTVLACVAASALALAACGGSSDGSDASNADAAGSDTAAGENAWPVVNAAIAGGGQFDLGEYAGTDVIVWFWAPW